jgi:hypothetical protein
MVFLEQSSLYFVHTAITDKDDPTMSMDVAAGVVAIPFDIPTHKNGGPTGIGERA